MGHRQYLFNVDDEDARRLVRRLTLQDEAEILAAEAAADIHPEGRDVQRLLIEGAAGCPNFAGAVFVIDAVCRCHRNGSWPGSCLASGSSGSDASRAQGSC